MRLKANPRMRVGTREYTVRLYSKKGVPVSTLNKAAKFSISLGKRHLQRTELLPKGLSAVEKHLYILMSIEATRRVARPTIKSVRTFTEKVLRTKSKKFKLLFYDSANNYVQKIEDAERFSISYRDFSLVLRHRFISDDFSKRILEIRNIFSKVRRWAFKGEDNFLLLHTSKRQFVARDYSPWRAQSWNSVLDEDIEIDSNNKEEGIELLRKEFVPFMRVIFSKQKKFKNANWVIRIGWTYESDDGKAIESDKDKKQITEHFSGGWSKPAFEGNSLEDFIYFIEELFEEIGIATSTYFSRKENLVLNISTFRADYRYRERSPE